MFKALFGRPEGLLVVTFAGWIVLGTLALWLPISQGERAVSLLDCIFTSTSAVCVTGLTTVDTAIAWSRTGHTVILVLIQVGGLGIMTFAAVGARVLRLRFSFSSQAALTGAFFDSDARVELRRSVSFIVAFTFVFEALGAAALWLAARVDSSLSDDPFDAIFHSVSAFCNAGFSVYTDNAVALRGSPLGLTAIAVLIILGGLGYTVVIELVARAWKRVSGRGELPLQWSLQTRVVLWMSLLLIVVGAACLGLLGLTPRETHIGERIVHASFQSISARTAGFNTLDVAALPVSSLLVLIGLMFIGGSPGSCAGGIKTTSAAVWLARLRARLLSRESVTMLRRRVPQEIVRRSALVLSVATLWNLLGVLVLTLSESRPDVRFEHLLFEQISAFGTVGLSCNFTPTLSPVGKLWIVLTMFVGRVGPLTLALAVLPKPRPLFQYPSERVMIG